MRFIGGSFASSLLALHLRRSALLWRLGIHGLSGLLLIPGRRWRILALLLLALRRVLISLLLWLLLLVVRQWLAVGAFWSVSQAFAQGK